MNEVRYVFMVYDLGIPIEKVTELLAETTADEVRIANREIFKSTQVWDGPVHDAKNSPVVEHLPDFIVKGDYNQKSMDNTNVLVVAVETKPIEVSV